MLAKKLLCLQMDECSEIHWRRTGMGTSSVSNGIAGLNWSYFMSCFQKEVVTAMPRTLLLLHVHICCRGHHFLSLVMNGVRGTEEGHVWVPAYFSFFIFKSFLPIVLVYFFVHGFPSHPCFHTIHLNAITDSCTAILHLHSPWIHPSYV
jgi:hypothetical protein